MGVVLGLRTCLRVELKEGRWGGGGTPPPFKQSPAPAPPQPVPRWRSDPTRIPVTLGTLDAVQWETVEEPTRTDDQGRSWSSNSGRNHFLMPGE